MPPANRKQLFSRPPKVVQPMRVVQPQQVSYTKAWQAIYTDAPSKDGVIARVMAVSCRIVKASICIDSLKDDEKALIRIEKVSGGEEYSFLVGAGCNTAPLDLTYKDGDKLILRAVVEPTITIKGVWLSFIVELN